MFLGGRETYGLIRLINSIAGCDQHLATLTQGNTIPPLSPLRIPWKSKAQLVFCQVLQRKIQAFPPDILVRRFAQKYAETVRLRKISTPVNQVEKIVVHAVILILLSKIFE